MKKNNKKEIERLSKKHHIQERYVKQDINKKFNIYLFIIDKNGNAIKKRSLAKNLNYVRTLNLVEKLSYGKYKNEDKYTVSFVEIERDN